MNEVDAGTVGVLTGMVSCQLIVYFKMIMMYDRNTKIALVTVTLLSFSIDATTKYVSHAML